jgi:hypothetical protein
MSKKIHPVFVVSGIFLIIFIIWLGLRIYVENQIVNHAVSLSHQISDVAAKSQAQKVVLALEAYNASHPDGYPPTLQALIDSGEMINQPVQPDSQWYFSYTTSDSNHSYTLCIEFKSKQPRLCFVAPTPFPAQP